MAVTRRNTSQPTQGDNIIVLKWPAFNAFLFFFLQSSHLFLSPSCLPLISTPLYLSPGNCPHPLNAYTFILSLNFTHILTFLPLSPPPFSHLPSFLSPDPGSNHFYCIAKTTICFTKTSHLTQILAFPPSLSSLLPLPLFPSLPVYSYFLSLLLLSLPPSPLSPLPSLSPTPLFLLGFFFSKIYFIIKEKMILSVRDKSFMGYIFLNPKFLDFEVQIHWLDKNNVISQSCTHFTTLRRVVQKMIYVDF